MPKCGWGLHGFIAVAQLKHVTTAAAATKGLIGLHGFIAVAQLKPFAPNHSTLHSACLHGFIAVAQLKLTNSLQMLWRKLRVSTASSPWPN